MLVCYDRYRTVRQIYTYVNKIECGLGCYTMLVGREIHFHLVSNTVVEAILPWVHIVVPADTLTSSVMSVIKSNVAVKFYFVETSLNFS